RRRVGEQRAVPLRELGLRSPRETVVRLVDAVRKRAVAERSPDHGEKEQADGGEGGPEPPAPPAEPARFGRAGGLRRGASGALEGTLALRAAAAIQPVGLVSLGHPGRYGSPRVEAPSPASRR